MPQYVVSAPDGKKYRVTAPEGASREEVMARVKQMQPPKEKSFWQGFLEGVEKPVVNTLRTLGSNIGVGPGNPILGPIVGPVAQMVSAKVDTEAKKQRDSAKYQGSTMGRIAGEVAGTLPTAAMPGGGLVQGAASGLLLSDQNDQKQVLKNAALGAASGYIGDKVGEKVIAPVVKKGVDVVKKAAGKSSIADDAVQQATAPLAALGDDAVERADRFARVGVQTPTTGMVTRDPRAWYVEQEGLKRLGVGDDILRQVQQVDDDLRNAALNLMQGYSGDTAEETGKAVSKALSDKSDELQQAVSGLYRQVRETRGDVPAGELINFRSALENPDLVDNATFDTIRNSLLRRMERLGLAGENMQRGNTVTVSQAEDLRKLIGKIGDSRDPTVRMVRKSLIDSLDEDVVNQIGDDAFKQARAAAKARFDEFSKTFAGNIAEGSIPPERLVQRTLSQARPIDDIRALVDSLVSGTDEQIARGGEALNQLRGQTLRDIIAPSLGPEGAPRAATLRRSFETNAPKLQALLPQNDYARLKDLVDAVGDATSAVPRSNVNYSNSGSTVANMFPDIAQGAPSRLRDILGMGMKAVGAGTGGAPGYALVEGADTAANILAKRKAAQAAERQIQLASNPQAAADALRQAELQRLAREALAPYANALGRGLSAPLTVGSVMLTQPQP